MVEDWAPKRVVVEPDPATLATVVADRFLRRVHKNVTRHVPVHVSLTGGSMGSAVLSVAADHPRVNEIDWSRVHFWWGDERFMPRGHPDRNETQARIAFLDALPIPQTNIHQVAASDEGYDLDAAAAAYAEELRTFADGDAVSPRFDICFLGVGPDGHIASLFPDRAEIAVTDLAVVPVRDSPKPPPERVSLTRPVINASERVWLVLTGEEKAPALGLALAGANYLNVPAGGAKGTHRTTFFTDVAAAAGVSADLIDRD